MEKYCTCELPYVYADDFCKCTKCGEKNASHVVADVKGVPYSTARKITKEEFVIGGIYEIFKKSYYCRVKIVEIYKDGWCRVELPNGGFHETQILGKRIL